MTISQMSTVIQLFRRAVLLRDGAGLTDGQLLADYIHRRDETALAAVVRRHGPMVWGVCRRVLADYHDAEDAFQATFLVLVRRAAAIASPELLANWLYGVARQTAWKARATTARRRAREKQVTQMPEPAVTEQGVWSDLQPLLDQELSRLPDMYRVAIILCDLEGKTRKEAARQLGVPEGTLAARVARGRLLLAKRLTRHGQAVSGGSLAAALAPNTASAGVPTSVVTSTIHAASLYAAGPAATSLISAKVAALADGVMKAMLLNKLKIATTSLLMVVLVGATVGTFLGAAPGPTPANEKTSKSPVAAQPAIAGQAMVARERLKDRHDEEWLRITGKVKVIDARTLEFDDGKRIELWYVAPRLNQMAMDGEKLHPAGREAAEFLSGCIGDNPVTCLHQTERNQYAVTAYVGDMSLNELMVVNGWAYSAKMPLPSEFAARENKRGLWRGRFTDPTDWEAGVRLPGEPPPPRIADEREAHQLIHTYHGRDAALTAVVARIVKDVPDVRVLDFSRTVLTNDSVAQLASLKSLQELSLGSRVTDAGLRHLKGMTGLRKLHTAWAIVSDAGIENLSGLTQLENLVLHGHFSHNPPPPPRISDAGLNHLKGLKKLRRLDLMHTHVSDAFLEHIATLTDLEDLQLHSTPITDAGLKHLKGLKKLRRLTLSSCAAITDTGLGHLSGLTNLEVLEVGGTRITNAGLPHLKGFANLAYLDIGNTEVTDAGVEHLWGLQKLQVAYLPHHISDPAWKRFQEAVPTVTGSSFPRQPGDYLTDPVKK